MKLFFYDDGRINLTMDPKDASRVGPLKLISHKNTGDGTAEAHFIQSPLGNSGNIPPGGLIHRYEFADKKRKGQPALTGETSFEVANQMLIVKVREDRVVPLSKVFGRQTS